MRQTAGRTRPEVADCTTNPCTRQHLTPLPFARQMFDIPEKPLRPEDLEKEVFVTLTETETFWMFEASSVTVSVESADAENVEARNAR